MQSVAITTQVLFSPMCGCIVIKFVSDLWQVGDFFQVLLLPQTIKLTAEILLKVALNTIILSLTL